MTPQERAEKAFEVLIGRILDVVVDHYDDGTRNGMVDALVHHTDGTVGALEVTTVVDQNALQMEAFGIHIDVPSSSHWWDLRYPGAALNMKQLRQHLPALIARLERLEMTDSDELFNADEEGPDIEWFERTEIDLRRWHERPEGGRVSILPSASGGGVDGKLEGLPAWIEESQREPWWTSNVAKLAASGHERLHLAVALHPTGVPFPLAYGMSDDEAEVQARDPSGMEPLTDLWLLPYFGSFIVHWSSAEGWSRLPYNSMNDGD